MTTVAIMQPYFIPYAGYFRIFAAADIVVMLDCVQFPRRGWVHRNLLPTVSGETDWFTLPIAKADRDVTIDHLLFASDGQERLLAASHRFPLVERARLAGHELVRRILDVSTPSVSDYLGRLISDINARLGLPVSILRASDLDIPPDVHGQDRIIHIAKLMHADRYVNPSGGRDLYDAQTFARHGLDLKFLNPYGSSTSSILERLLIDDAEAIRAEIFRESSVSD